MIDLSYVSRLQKPKQLLLGFLLAVCLFCFSTGQIWSGTATDSSTAVTLDGASAFTSAPNIVLSLSVATTSTTDSILLLINMNIVSTGTGQTALFTIFRDGVDLNLGKIMVRVDPTVNGESQCVSFTYMDIPGTVGTFLYTIRGSFNGIVSSNNQKRQLAALVLPSAVPTNSLTRTAFFDVTGTSYVGLALFAGLTPTSITDRVLVTASFSMDPQADNSAANIALFRDNVKVGETVQLIKMSATDDSRMFSMLFLHDPMTTVATSYSIRVSLYSSNYGAYKICDSDIQMAHLNLMAVPSASSDFTTATDALVISATSWTTIGLSASVTPPSTSTKVLITVTLNYRPDQATSKGAFTIFRGTTNLGDSTNGMQVMQMPTNDINAGVTMSFLDTPSSTGTLEYTVQVKSLVSGTTFRISYNNQMRQIAAIMTHSPIVLTAQPTLGPTVTPSLPILDCTSSCSFPGAIVASVGYAYKRFTLPKFFTLTFSVTLPTLVSGNPNILDIRDVATGNSLLAVHRASNTHTQWSYDGVVIINPGLPLISGSIGVTPNVVTTYTVVVQTNSIKIDSTYQTGVFTSVTIQNVDTTQNVYELFLSNGVDVSATATVSNVGITGTLVNAHYLLQVNN